MNSEPVCRSGSWTPKESLPPILPQLKVELHDDQTFLMKNPLVPFIFYLLSSNLNLQSSTYLGSTSSFNSLVITETKFISLLKQHLGVFHHGLKWIPTHIKPVQSSSTQVNFTMQYKFGWIVELSILVLVIFQMNFTMLCNIGCITGLHNIVKLSTFSFW